MPWLVKCRKDLFSKSGFQPIQMADFNRPKIAGMITPEDCPQVQGSGTQSATPQGTLTR